MVITPELIRFRTADVFSNFSFDAPDQSVFTPPAHCTKIRSISTDGLKKTAHDEEEKVHHETLARLRNKSLF
jgi:hypothetical protein